MSFFSMMLFNQLFSVYNECSQKYEKDSDEYKKCKKIHLFSSQLLDEFLQQNQELLNQYIKMLEEFENQQFLMQMYSIQKKIDDEIDQYISKEEQIGFIGDYFRFKDLIEEYEFNRL